MIEREIGVGPHPKPWPNDPKYDPDLLENGDKRNVLDKYRYWTNQAIVDDLNKTRQPLHIAIENYQHDFNIGTIVRSANAFNVDVVHIIGRRQWNKRGAMVTNRYLDVVYHKTVEDFLAAMKIANLTVVAVDNVESAKDLSTVKLPPDICLVFGGEGPGLSDEILKVAAQTIKIEQFGSTRSINVGVAAGIVMYEWLRQNTLKQ